MKLVVAGCSFSDYMEKNSSVYGEQLAAFIGATYIHEGAGSGSNWRVWRTVGNMIRKETITRDDIVVVQYSNNERNEFWTANPPDKQRIINGVARNDLREPSHDDGALLRWKFDCHTWMGHPYPKEAKFAKMYEQNHVSVKFAQEQFDAHNIMFQALLRQHKIRCVFLRSRINQNFELDEDFEATSYTEEKEDQLDESFRYEPKDVSHLNDKGHYTLARKLNTHIKSLGWK
mgnify:CR=1 FL=1|jgi:hypothetical protein